MMKTHNGHSPLTPPSPAPADFEQQPTIDYVWLDQQFKLLLERMRSLEASLMSIESTVANPEPATAPATPREYYSTAEFAAEVGKAEYTVREWARLGRINAEKRDSGRGDAKGWKIPVSELQRWRDHGLLPAVYLR